jgi:hypothetical protein
LRETPAVSAGFAPADLTALLKLLESARRDLDRRLIELGEAEPSSQAILAFALADTAPPAPDAEAVSVANLYANACRACGRALGAAFREAQAVADAASASVLYAPLRALEKQMWFFDPLQNG